MAETTFQIFKLSDKKLIQAIQTIGEASGGFENVQMVCEFAPAHQQNLTGALPALLENEIVIEISSCNSAIFNSIQAKFPNLGNAVIRIERQSGSDLAKVKFANDLAPDKVAKTITLAHENLQAYERTESTDKLLGDELSEFYRKREQGLIKLEEIAQNLIERNEQYRLKIDTEKDNFRDRIESTFRLKENSRETELNDKINKLKKREENLEKLKSEIDDRTSKHARRQIRKDLKIALANRSEEFSLTKSTIQKRGPIHFLFISLLIVSGIFVSNSIMLSFLVTKASFSWYDTIRLCVSAFTLVATIIFYIRWIDSWFRRHADEEFRLKQLELDIDRASWVVEMALEWKDEKGTEIPSNLIDKLTENLFIKSETNDKASHPSEDIVSAIIKASTGLSINIPGIGNVNLDKGGIKNLNKRIEKPVE